MSKASVVAAIQAALAEAQALPDDAPPPPPPPPLEQVTPDVKAVGLAQVLVAPGYYFGDRYDRMQSPLIVSGARATLTVQTRNIAAGGTRPAFGFAAELSLLFDGRPVAVATTVATANSVAFDVPLTGRRGWYRTSVVGAPAEWSVLDYAVFVSDGSGDVPTHMPVVIGSYGLTHPYRASSTEPYNYVHVSAMVPARFAPVTQPYQHREFPAFTTDPGRSMLVQTQLAICRQDDKHRPVALRGVLNTCNRQDYFWSDVTERRPWFHMLDGPRGRGTVTCPTHIEVGRFTFADGGRNVYVCEPQRVVRVGPDGTVTTLVGYRHREPVTHWSDPAQDVELVGNWDAVSVAERGFRELWGLCWDSRTTATNETAAPIPAEGNLRPHIVGVTYFVTDMLNHRVCRIQADPMSHATPRRVSVFWTGGEPWDCVELGQNSGLMAVSVRLEGRIVVLDMTTGAVVDSFAAVAPEGLFYQDGWLYYGSKTAKSVRKRNLATGEDVLFRDLTAFVDNNSMYVKLAVSDGTFGLRGMVATVTWSNNGYGYPHLFKPTGGEVAGWLWQGTARPGPLWLGAGGDPAPGYPTAVALAHGRMICGTVQEGLMQISRALPTDEPCSAAYMAGLRQWYERGYQLTHSHRGFGLFGLPQPWGVTPEIDAFLTGNGHTQ